MSERWLTENEAAALIRGRIGGSVGRAENALRTARQSGEVRVTGPLLLADDGIIDIPRAGRPAPSAITISENDLADWLNRHHGPAAAPPTRSASAQEIRSAMFLIANDPANDRPNVKRLAKLTVAHLRAAGAIASENQVITLADAPEFKKLRRPPGKTKRSGG